MRSVLLCLSALLSAIVVCQPRVDRSDELLASSVSGPRQLFDDLDTSIQDLPYGSRTANDLKGLFASVALPLCAEFPYDYHRP
jgi:hypothetical protein